jgi:hypothetical protein
VIEVTHLLCPDSEFQTHHLVTKHDALQCVGCGKTEAVLREEAENNAERTSSLAQYRAVELFGKEIKDVELPEQDFTPPTKSSIYRQIRHTDDDWCEARHPGSGVRCWLRNHAESVKHVLIQAHAGDICRIQW